MSVPAVILPIELLQTIFSYFTACDQGTLYTCTLVSRSWYSASTSCLYKKPVIVGKNFDAFVRAICPSINAHIRTNGLAECVRTLDMSALVHNGSKSLTARILGRVKEKLEEFVAPQASFAFVPSDPPSTPEIPAVKIASSNVNCLAALSKCSNLRRLDLSFVSESVTMADLLRSTSALSKLDSLHLPRSSTSDSSKDPISYDWPSKLRELHISGGIHDGSILALSNLTPSVTYLSVRNCANLTMLTIRPLLEAVGPRLQRLELLAPIPALELGNNPANNIMDLLPNLHRLTISVDFIDKTFLPISPPSHPLSRLDLDCFDPAMHDLTLDDVFDAIDSGPFKKIRILGIHHRLGWTGTTAKNGEMKDIDELLKAFAREEDPEERVVREEDAGVVLFGNY